MKVSRVTYEVRVFILTDSNGEWWEWVGGDGTTRRFKPGTATLNLAKQFPTAEKAAKFAGLNYAGKRWEVYRQTPPAPPATTWTSELVRASEVQS